MALTPRVVCFHRHADYWRGRVGLLYFFILIIGQEILSEDEKSSLPFRYIGISCLS